MTDRLSGKTALSIIQAMNASPITQKPFFFTDGSKDTDLLADQTAWIKTLLLAAHGTAPATGAGADYMPFAADLKTAFNVDPSAFSFLAQAYDATYVGALGTVFASRSGTSYTGIDVGVGMTHLNSGVSAENQVNQGARKRGGDADEQAHDDQREPHSRADVACDGFAVTVLVRIREHRKQDERDR